MIPPPPPNLLLSQVQPPNENERNLSEAIGGAAIAIVKALKSDPKEKSSHAVSALGADPGVSPGHAVDLRMKITNN